MWQSRCTALWREHQSTGEVELDGARRADASDYLAACLAHEKGVERRACGEGKAVR